MDHQIKDHAYIGAATLENTETMGFDETGMIDFTFQLDDRWIETLQMPHLDDQSFGISNLNQFIGITENAGYRLFDQDIDVLIQEIFGYLVVDRRWGGDTNRIHLSEKRLMVPKEDRTILIGDFFSLDRIRVDDTDKIHIRHMVVFLGVKFTQITHANDTDAQFSHWQSHLIDIDFHPMGH
jgi:hypothetical protein